MRSGDFQEKKTCFDAGKIGFCHCAAILKSKSQSQAERRRRGACRRALTPLLHHAVDSGPHFTSVSMNDTLYKHVKSLFTFFLLLLLQTHLQHSATYCSTLQPADTISALMPYVFIQYIHLMNMSAPNLMILVSFTTHRRTERYCKTLKDITRNIYEKFSSHATCSSVYRSVMQYTTV